jgi:hypothetical protein
MHHNVAKATLVEILKEMAKPRVAMSARGARLGRKGVLVVENNVEKRTVNFKAPRYSGRSPTL